MLPTQVDTANTDRGCRWKHPIVHLNAPRSLEDGKTVYMQSISWLQNLYDASFTRASLPGTCSIKGGRCFTGPPHLFHLTNMGNSVALWAVALSFFIAIGSASGLGDVHLGFRSSSGCDRVSAGYYPGWDAKILPLDQVSWDKYTHVTYAFV